MAMANWYGINLQFDNTLANTPANDQSWQAILFYKPSTPASGPTAPGVTTGPLGATGTATAVRTLGDGTQKGFANAMDALQRALLYIADDRSIGN